MLYKREIKKNFKPFIAITVVCSALVFYIVSMAPSFGSDIQQILDMKLPKGMQNALGMDGLNFNSPSSFYTLSFSYIYLFFSIFASGVFATIVSKEFSEKTGEYLFSLPAPRIKLIMVKLSAGFTYILLWACIIFASSWFSFQIHIQEGYDLKPVILMTFAWLLGGIAFASAAFLMSSFLNKARTISGASVALVMAMYMLQLIISFNDSLSFLKYISPFDWFKGSEIANTGQLSIEYSLIAIVISIICFTLGVIRFQRKDVLI
jgi:ABC-2 type transport system permease protein